MSDERTVWWAVTIASTDPRRLASFWSALLGAVVTEVGADRPGWLRLRPLAPHGPFINFQPVPEANSGKARIHLDILVGDLQAGLARVIELGGSDTGRRDTLPRGRIAVMRDPEGNEFCLLAGPAH